VRRNKRSGSGVGIGPSTDYILLNQRNFFKQGGDFVGLIAVK
jgi:hypothetical protein